jgi:hypothetical protein
VGGTPYIPSILIDDVIDALDAFLQPFCQLPNSGGNAPITRGQVNRVSMPLTGFVELTELNALDLGTPVQCQSSDPDIQQASISDSVSFDVQIDFYGPSAGDWARAVKNVFRSPYAPDQFPAGMAPLYCSEPHRAKLVTGEEQYEYRWVITATLEYNPVVIVPQLSATALKTNIFEDLP